MKAYLIDPVKQFISRTEIQTLDDIKQLIGSENIESEQVEDTGDHLFRDDGTKTRDSKDRFQLDNMIPVAGKGVIVGSGDDSQELSDANLDMYYLSRRVSFF